MFILEELITKILTITTTLRKYNIMNTISIEKLEKRFAGLSKLYINKERRIK